MPQILGKCLKKEVNYNAWHRGCSKVSITSRIVSTRSNMEKRLRWLKP